MCACERSMQCSCMVIPRTIIVLNLITIDRVCVKDHHTDSGSKTCTHKNPHYLVRVIKCQYYTIMHLELFLHHLILDNRNIDFTAERLSHRSCCSIRPVRGQNGRGQP